MSSFSELQNKARTEAGLDPKHEPSPPNKTALEVIAESWVPEDTSVERGDQAVQVSFSKGDQFFRRDDEELEHLTEIPLSLGATTTAIEFIKLDTPVEELPITHYSIMRSELEDIFARDPRTPLLPHEKRYSEHVAEVIELHEHMKKASWLPPRGHVPNDDRPGPATEAELRKLLRAIRPERKAFALRLPIELYEAISVLAEDEGVSMNAWIVDVLWERID